MTELEILQAIRADLATVKSDVAHIKAVVGGHTRVLNVLRQDVVMVQAAMNDTERTKFTACR